MSRDPLGIWADSGQRGNGHTYCGANPTNLTDPLGLHESFPKPPRPPKSWRLHRDQQGYVKGLTVDRTIETRNGSWRDVTVEYEFGGGGMYLDKSRLDGQGECPWDEWVLLSLSVKRTTREYGIPSGEIVLEEVVYYEYPSGKILKTTLLTRSFSEMANEVGVGVWYLTAEAYYEDGVLVRIVNYYWHYASETARNPTLDRSVSQEFDKTTKLPTKGTVTKVP